MWLGGTLLLLGSEHVGLYVAGGSARCWVLRRHLCGVFFLVPPPGRVSNAFRSCCVGVGVVVVVGWGCGCVLSVA